jgi:hypothetical protein
MNRGARLPKCRGGGNGQTITCQRRAYRPAYRAGDRGSAGRGRADAVAQELEYTRATLLQMDPVFCQETQKFFHDFAKAAAEWNVADYLGVCLLDRENFPIDKILETGVESMDIWRPANIVVVRPRAEIRTHNFYGWSVTF